MKKYEIEINGEFYEVSVRELTADADMSSGPTTEKAPPVTESETSATVADTGAGTDVSAPMSGTILRIHVQAGQKVSQGDTLLILEAMKMENEVVAPADGTIQTVHVQENERVSSNQLLVTL